MKRSKRFYTVPEAALLFGVDRRTMQRWVKSQKVHAWVTPGGHHRIPLSEVDRLMEISRHRNGAAGGVRNILIVDDDPAVRKILKRQFLRHRFAVETAADGFAAGLKIQKMKPDLVLLDLMMEGVDGFQVCRTIKQDASLKDIKIVVLTGFDTPRNRARAIEAGADGYLSKGVEPRAVVAAVHNLLMLPTEPGLG